MSEAETIKTAVVIVSDTHINSTIALAPPVVQLDDGGTYHASRPQRWLWECWNDQWETIGRDYRDWRKILILMGDLGELDTRRRSVQLITANKATILRTVIDVLEPALSIVQSVYVVRGTQAHVGKGAWLEEDTAKDITISVHPDGMASWYWLRATASGVRFDLAHHAAMGGLPWTAANSANKLAFLAETYYRRIGQAIPHIVGRAHNHTYADSGDNYEVFAFFNSAWSLMTEFGYRQGYELRLSHIGSTLFECNNGQFDRRRFRYEPRHERRVWAIQM